MLKLYGSARSRAAIIQWYLEEIGHPYEFVTLDFAAGEHRQPAFLAINPFGKMPAIVDGDFPLWESGAILLYLAEKYGPALSVETKSTITQWVLFANSTLFQGIFVDANREKDGPRIMGALDEIFNTRSFLVDDQFTIADVAVGAILFYIPMAQKMDLSPYPGVLKYIDMLSNRPAFAKTMGVKK